jgi:hypothetical protein
MVGYFALWLDFLTAGRTLELTDEVIVKQNGAIIQHDGFYPFIGLALLLFRVGKQVNQSSLVLWNWVQPVNERDQGPSEKLAVEISRQQFLTVKQRG